MFAIGDGVILPRGEKVLIACAIGFVEVAAVLDPPREYVLIGEVFSGCVLDDIRRHEATLS